MILHHSKFEQELQHMITTIRQRAYHPYVQEFVTYPDINLFQLHFTYLFLTAQGCTQQESEWYCISQTFIRLGLESHDQVGLPTIREDHAIKNRQLTVLSGDFFSSCYYHYLAEHKQIKLIQKWAVVIKEINELKANLHYRKKGSSTDSSHPSFFKINNRLTDAILTWFEAPPYWYEMNRLFSPYIHQFNGEEFLKEKEQLLAQIFAAPEEWIQRELHLWLDKLDQQVLVTEAHH